MHNPFDLAGELREMNKDMIDRLDRIIKRLDVLIEMTRDERYGDGK